MEGQFGVHGQEQEQDSSNMTTTPSLPPSQDVQVDNPALPSTQAPPPTTSTPGDPTATEQQPLLPDQQLQPPSSRRSKRWPAYFFPSLATQRTSFCLDVLKREDIKSVCEFGCGQGAVLRPMTNGATHIDSFPEAMFDEASLMAEEVEDDDEEAEDGERKAIKDDGDEEAVGSSTGIATSTVEEDDDDEDSLAPSQSASRRHSLDIKDEDHATTSADGDSRGRSPPRGRSGGAAPSSSAFNPARRASRSLTPEPVSFVSTSKSPSLNTEILDKYKKLPGPRVQDKELHLRRIAGLDISHDSLLEAIEVTTPPPEEPSPFFTYFSYSNRDRWEDLRVELWQGSLDVYNDALDNFEAFIMTEVIEHLHEKQLNKFPEILFGNYRPRIIVITTPNYDFNQYFNKAKQSSSDEVSKEYTGEKSEDETKNSFKDPTGRTERYFRDSDHKFEWTEKEFRNWCSTITSKYDYSVEYSGVGSLRNYFGKGGMYSLSEDLDNKATSSSSSSSSKVPPPHIQEILDSVPDPSKVFATQTAIFRRKFAYESERSPRSPVQMPLAFYGIKPISKRPLSSASSNASSSITSQNLVAGGGGPGLGPRRSAKSRSNAANDNESDSSASRSPDQRHKLLKAHYFKACPQSGNAKSSKTIRRILDNLMRDRMRARSASLRELWGRNEIAQACGGYINKLIQALVKDSECKWDIEFDSATLEKGGEVEDAVLIILKDFIEPERPNYNKALEGQEEEENDDVKEPYVKNQENDSDDSDDENTGSRLSNNGNKVEGDGQSTIIIEEEQPKLSKKQKKLKRMEEAPFLLPIFPLENEPVWMPEKGSEEDNIWKDWTDPAKGTTMITEEEWSKDPNSNTTSGWD